MASAPRTATRTLAHVASSSYFSIGTSWDRRWQALAVWSASFEFIGALGTAILLSLIALYKSKGRPAMLAVLAYVWWALFKDDSAYRPRRARRLPFAKWWHSYADYFPLTLVKTAEIEPDGRYVFGYHPHGVISCGVFGGFITEGARTLDLSKGLDAEQEASTTRRGFSALFPGIEPRTVTLAMNLRPPFLREYFLSLGALVADRKTFHAVLSRGSGAAICVVVGGAEEAQETRQGGISLVLEKRKGFVREAMVNGAKLVPVLAFGENDLYTVKNLREGSWGRRLQDKLRKALSFSMPIFVGRSIFLKAFGLMPMRKPIWVVVGAPVECEHLPQFDSRNAEHTQAVADAHGRYVQAIEELYDRFKDHPLQPYRSVDEPHREKSRPEFTRLSSKLHSSASQEGGLRIAS